jgi:type IV secretion system protein TrbL
MNMGLPNPIDVLGKFNPFGVAGDIAGKAVADGWTGIMMALWTSGLWVLRFALGVMDRWMTPDITADGPAAEVYRTTFWAAGVLVLIMTLVQLGLAAFRRDGKSLARAVIGIFQFTAVWAAAITYGAAVIAACSGISRALMESLLEINDWSNWTPMSDADFGKSSIEVGLATVLGILSLFLWMAAIGHFVIMLTRAAALLILAASTPIAAAGLVSEAGRSWFWSSMRWFHAAALTPVLTVLMMGMGVKLTSGVAQGGSETAEAAVGTAFPGVMLILVSVVAPVALFKLLAFVDPGTSSGASMRAGMASAGGLQGLMSGGPQSPSPSTSAASQATSSGQSQGEAQSNQATSGRFAGALSSVTGAAGSLYSAGMGMVSAAGASAAAVGIDQMNQTGVGDSSYFPDYQRGGQRFTPGRVDANEVDARENGENGPDQEQRPSSGDVPSSPMPSLPSDSQGRGPAASSSGGAPTGRSAGGVAGAAAEVPPIV